MSVAQKADRLLLNGHVQVLWATDEAISARVRGDSSIYDIRWHRHSGWTCSCACLGPRCSHIAAVRRVTMRNVKAPEPAT